LLLLCIALVLAKDKDNVAAFNKLKDTRYGRMMFNTHDHIIGASLEHYGEWSTAEIKLLRAIVKEGDTVVDVGAHIGTFAVPLAKAAGPSGVVYAFEPQRMVFQLLTGNVALNSLSNVLTFRQAVGETEVAAVQIAALDPEANQNWGAFSIKTASARGDGEPLRDSDNHVLSELNTVAAVLGNTVSQTTIDALKLPDCKLIKVDAEHMEVEVLKGGWNTVTRLRPYLFLERHPQSTSETMQVLDDLLKSADYAAYYITSPYFSEDNYNKNNNNGFNPGAGHHNMLAVPQERLKAVSKLMAKHQRLF